MRLFNTEKHKKFWKERKIDWKKEYLDTWNHPHRQLIIWALQSIRWVSLWEIGCGPGANLVKIVDTYKPTKDSLLHLGGSDVNPEAIELARKTFTGGKFHVESAEDMLLSDGAVDVMLSDATLIYIDPLKIKKTLREMFIITRNYFVFCEFHSESWWKRWIFRLKTGYNAYNYHKLLEELGCYDIQMHKITKEFWDGTPWTEFGYIILCRIPKK